MRSPTRRRSSASVTGLARAVNVWPPRSTVTTGSASALRYQSAPWPLPLIRYIVSPMTPNQISTRCGLPLRRPLVVRSQHSSPEWSPRTSVGVTGAVRDRRTSAARLVDAEHAAQRVADLAEARSGAQRLLHRVQDVLRSPRRVRDVRQLRLHLGRVARRLELSERPPLRALELRVDREQVGLGLRVEAELVDA